MTSKISSVLSVSNCILIKITFHVKAVAKYTYLRG